MRLARWALVLVPFLLYGLVLATLGRRPAARPALALVLLGLAACGVALAWFGLHEGAPAGAAYHPATLQDGRVVPGHLGD